MLSYGFTVFFSIFLLFPLSFAVRFVVIEDTNFSPFRTDLLLHDLSTRMECVIACHVMATCVGGRFYKEQCELTLDKFGRMGYRNKGQESGDFVFGLFCDPALGYLPSTTGYISGENHKVYSGIAGISECQEKCTPLLWCLSADIDNTKKTCFLAGLNKDTGRFISEKDANFLHTEKHCIAT